MNWRLKINEVAGLMISAFARGFAVLNEAKYLTAAKNAARFIRAKLYNETSRTLIRNYRDGPRLVLILSL